MHKLIASAFALVFVLATTLPQTAQARSSGPDALFQPPESALLQMVNEAVNASHSAGAPLPSDPDGVWDCDNYAVGKYRSLRDDFHWSPNRLAIGIVRLPDGRKHMVVLVRGAAGWAILDNLTNQIVPLAERARDHWRVEFAAIEPSASPSASWVMVSRLIPVAFRG